MRFLSNLNEIYDQILTFTDKYGSLMTEIDKK